MAKNIVGLCDQYFIKCQPIICSSLVTWS